MCVGCRCTELQAGRSWELGYDSNRNRSYPWSSFLGSVALHWRMRRGLLTRVVFPETGSGRGDRSKPSGAVWFALPLKRWMLLFKRCRVLRLFLGTVLCCPLWAQQTEGCACVPSPRGHRGCSSSSWKSRTETPALLGVRLPFGHGGRDAKCSQGCPPCCLYKVFSLKLVASRQGSFQSFLFWGLLKHMWSLHILKVMQKSWQLCTSLMLLTVLYWPDGPSLFLTTTGQVLFPGSVDSVITWANDLLC